MIGHGVVARFRRWDRADTPAAKKDFTEQSFPDSRGRVRLRNSGKKALPGIGASNPARLLVSIKGDCVGFNILAPESFMELRFDPFRSSLKLPGSLVKPQCLGQPGRA